MSGELWPLGVFALLCLLLAAGMILVSRLLGERHSERATVEPYESGIVSTGSARVRLSPRFYLIAVFFVIFDLEAAFLIAWAVAVEEAGWTGFVEILIFVVVLLAALFYLWRQGALDWGPSPAAGTAHRRREPRR